MAILPGSVYRHQKLQFSINEIKLFDFGYVPVKNQALRATLTTYGRKTGAEHTVQLRAVSHNGMIYFSRRNSESDWLKNALANPKVRVGFDDKMYGGTASLVSDKSLAKKISELKYPGEQRAQEVRVVLQVMLE
ncbi:hypothetical protein DSQ19_02430 [Candidatus Nitrosotenuis sp. DW1]|nr:hypothetical protein DSQ19_02430 [Candidatus Nitrosotenuis sp. DW1]